MEGPDGQRFWGRFGAAGLLVHDLRRGVLLQHRADWSHFGGTWGLPGGARHAGETAVQGALREAAEEAAVPPDARMELSVARACVAARSKDANAFELIDAAIREVSGVADRMPLDSDTQFSYLAAAARDIGDASLEHRALAQHEKYRDIRRVKIAG